MTEYTTSPTDDGGVVVPAHALDADGDGRPDYAEPTQVRFPMRAAVRTALAVLVGMSLVLPIAWGIVNDELARHGWVVSAPVAATVATLIAAVSAAAGIVTRVMAIPQVSELLTRVGIGPTPGPDA